MKKRMFYHVIEDCGYGRIGTHGFYTNEEEAKKEVERLTDYFPSSFFYVYASTSKREPEIVTI